ncbi:MAG: anti-sigma factor antagonist [Ruminiclostridium sp.]|nr:anti-sigma factor antagonist [Ruminiclostridium sp.]
MNDTDIISAPVRLSGRVDTNNAEQVQKELIDALDRAPGNNGDIVIDAEELDYISSAGLRVLMKLSKSTGRKLRVINVSRNVYDIFETTGFTEIFDIQKAYRKLSVEGCEIIGRGFYGTVYRTDPETIVKVYKSPESLSMINNEKRLAKTALVAGVPTAISYDVVRVGDSFGSVFELLNAKSFNDLLTEARDDPDPVIKQYAEFLRLVNSQTVPEGKLASAKEIFLGYTETAAKYISHDLYERVKTMISEIPDQLNVVHGDAQMKNVMLRDGEPMLIDMDTLSAGHPIFDLQSVYVTYDAFCEDDEDSSLKFLGYPSELSRYVWKKFVGYYFGTEDEARISELRDKIEIVGCIRFLFLVDTITEHDTELFGLRVKHTAERLERLAGKTGTLLFG